MIFYVLAGLAVGICAGLYFPVYIPPEYGKMLSVALMAALDTAFGGIRSSMEGSYDNTVGSFRKQQSLGITVYGINSTP